MDIYNQLVEIIDNNVLVNDEKELFQKGLYQDGKFSDKYYKLYLNYKMLLDKYLLDKYDLKKYDDEISKSELKLVPVNREKMDYYQYMSFMGLNYIYLRNNLYVEKLSEEDIDKIVKLSIDDINNPSKEILDLIERTYLTVIDMFGNQDTKGFCRYGPDDDDYWFESNELVFGMIFDEFPFEDVDDNWEDNYNKQLIFFRQIRDSLINNSQIDNNKVNFVWYNEFTVDNNILKK